MGVKIRLSRTGATNTPCYRVVATDARTRRDGRSIELLGWYRPRETGSNCSLKMDRIAYWVSRGATLSDTVRSLVKRGKAGAASVRPAAPSAASAGDAGTSAPANG